MSKVLIEDINREAVTDINKFIKHCEGIYSQKISYAAGAIERSTTKTRIVLLSGPSSSSKTTTSHRLAQELSRRGINSYVISLDNYFNSPHEQPVFNEKGEMDYESPLCLDIPLLRRHFKDICSGREVEVPVFDFTQSRRSSGVIPIQAGKHDIVIFEGIHALNPMISGEIGKEAKRIYIRVGSQVYDLSGHLVLPKNEIRLCRRIIRDKLFRGAGVDFTLKLWPGVREGERKYIIPYRHLADLKIDTFVPYELCVFAKLCLNELDAMGEPSPIPETVERLRRALPLFTSVDEALSPSDSIIREFIGGSIY